MKAAKLTDTITKPMLADAIEPSEFKNLKYPVLASLKIDGIRCILTSQGAFSRSGKLIPNKFIQKTLRDYWKTNYEFNTKYTMIDGELTVGRTFQSCTSGIMSFEGQPDFRYSVFDIIDDGALSEPAVSRKNKLEEDLVITEHLQLLMQEEINSAEELLAFYTKAITDGYEGIIVRGFESPYKQGRSTRREEYLLKVKPFETAEAVVLDLIEREHNTNEATKDELGNTKRSSAIVGMVKSNTLGAFKVQALDNPELTFFIGTGLGLDDALRAEIWSNKEEYIGKIVMYKTQKIGTLNKPRIPVFLGFRDEKDL